MAAPGAPVAAAAAAGGAAAAVAAPAARARARARAAPAAARALAARARAAAGPAPGRRCAARAAPAAAARARAAAGEWQTVYRMRCGNGIYGIPYKQTHRKVHSLPPSGRRRPADEWQIVYTNTFVFFCHESLCNGPLLATYQHVLRSAFCFSCALAVPVLATCRCTVPTAVPSPSARCHQVSQPFPLAGAQPAAGGGAPGGVAAAVG